jgi:hypothetical protein
VVLSPNLTPWTYSGAISRNKLMTRPVFQLLATTSEALRAKYETLFETYRVK